MKFEFIQVAQFYSSVLSISQKDMLHAGRYDMKLQQRYAEDYV